MSNDPEDRFSAASKARSSITVTGETLLGLTPAQLGWLLAAACLAGIFYITLKGKVDDAVPSQRLRDTMNQLYWHNPTLYVPDPDNPKARLQ